MTQQPNFMGNLLRKTNRSRSAYGFSGLFFIFLFLGSLQGQGQNINTTTSAGGTWSGTNPAVWTPSSSTWNVNVADITTRLASGNVTVNGFSGGNIVVANAITYANTTTTQRTLTIIGSGNIQINGAINLSGGSNGTSLPKAGSNLIITATGGSVTISAALTTNGAAPGTGAAKGPGANAGSLTITASTFILNETIGAVINSNGTTSTESGQGAPGGNGGVISLTASGASGGIRFTQAITANGGNSTDGGANGNAGTVSVSTSNTSITTGNGINDGISGVITLTAGTGGTGTSGTFTKIGNGNLRLSGTNTYAGVTNINAGTLTVSSDANLGTAPGSPTAGNITFGGGTLATTASFTLSANRGIAFSSAATIDVASSTTLTYGGIAAGLQGVTKTGAGTLTLSGLNTYSGGTTITGGTFQLGASNVIPNTGTITLNGGTLSTGATTGFTETVGALNISNNSTIALGTGSHTITFAASNAVSWTASRTLTVTGWTGTGSATGTAGKIFFGSTNTGLSVSQLGATSFSGYATAAMMLANGECVPTIPACSGTPVPGDLSITSPSSCSAIGLSTTLSLEVPMTESGLSYQWQESSNNSTWSDIPTATSSTYIATLTSANTYFRLKVTCANGGSIGYSNSGLIYYDCSNYCNPTTGSTTSVFPISNVQVGDINNSSPATAGVASSVPVFQNFTTLSTTVFLNSSYPVSVTGTGNGSNIFAIAYFADWNSDGDFADAGEGPIQLGATYTTASATRTGTITIPSTANLGSTRLRFFNYYTAINPLTSCPTTGNYAAEDYAIVICANPTISSPASASTVTKCAGENTSFSVTATSPTGTGTITYQWQVNSGSGYSNISNGLGYSGATSTTLSITGVSTTISNYLYRCVVSNSCGGTANSAASTLIVNPLPNATFTGVSNYGTLCQGQDYTLTPVTSGGSWSVSNGTFLSVNNGVASILPNTTPNGAQSNIVYSVTSNGCTNTSTVSNLFLQPTPSAPSITAQSLCNGTTHTVSSLPSGTGYVWYGSADATVAFTSNLILGNTYYVSQTLNGCTSARTPVSTISTGDTYGTRASGYWDGSSTWERYCYSGNSYSMTPVSLSTPPASDYAGEIVIKNGHTIQIGSSVSTESIDKVISAELEINSGGKLHILSNGSLRTSENIVNSGEFRIKSGGQLVQESNVDPAGNGDYIFEKDLPAIANSNLANYNRSYYIGSPVVGVANSPLSISSVLGSSTAALTMYSFTESTNAWPLHYNGAQQNNVGSTFEIGKGYFVNSSPALVSGATYFGQAVFTGKSFNNGDITVPLTFGAGNGYNLISNPYPSSIKWTQILPANSNAATTYWVRTYEDGMGMVYKNFVTNGANSGVGTDETVTDYIAPGQAFWVKINSNNANATSFTFTNSMRTHIPGVAHTGEANRVVRLNLTNALGHKDRAVVYLNEDAALTYDSYDSDKRIPSTTVHQLYSLEGTTKLAINGFNNALAKDTVLLGMQIPTAGTYTINASQIDATIEEDVFLEDKITGAYQNLKTTPSYSFTSTQGTFNNRFVLHFAPYVPALPGQTAATAIAMPTSNWPQCNNVTTEDQWHAFTATSEGISIAVNTATADLTIELQDGTGNVVAQENAVNGIGNETLNFFGLTAGQTYKVGVRNNISSQPTGTYGICVKSLKRGGCDYGAGPYSLCQYYKATWAGSTGVSYTFTFTGTSGPAAGQTFTRTQNSDICVLSTVTPLLPYGSTYDVVISNTYTLTDGAGNTEQITVPSINGCQVITIAEPQTTLSNSSSCNNGARFRGAVVSSMPWVCGANNWRWRFTEVNPLTMQEVGLPIELNRGSASNYLSLGTVAQLQNGKTYAVQTAPIFNYTGTNYNWGPVQYMCIVGAAGMTLEGADAAQEAAQGSNKDALQSASRENDVLVYAIVGQQIKVWTNIENAELTNSTVRIYNSTGSLVYTQRMSNNDMTIDLDAAAGLYIVEVGGVKRKVKI